MDKHNFLLKGHTTGITVVCNINYDNIFDELVLKYFDNIYFADTTRLFGYPIKLYNSYLSWFRFWCYLYTNPGASLDEAIDFDINFNGLAISKLKDMRLISETSYNEYSANMPELWKPRRTNF